jgi:glutamate/aspartate transport system substrate-binding protein
MSLHGITVRWPWLVAGVIVLASLAHGSSQSLGADGPAALDGTLKKIKESGTITLGYRDSSRPFSFTDDGGKPAGYSVDLCSEVVTGVGRQLALPALKTKWVKVTVADRMKAVADGTIDLECGSTTAALSRYEQVDFSLLTYVDGASLLVRDASDIKDVASLGGKKVAVIPGTTTETRLTEALAKRHVTATIVPVTDHAAGVAALDKATADAYASDRSILVGVGRTSANVDKLSLIEEYFSYEPYGLMLRRSDPAFRLAVNRALAAVYRSGDIVPIYEKWFGSVRNAGPFIAAMFLLNAVPE